MNRSLVFDLAAGIFILHHEDALFLGPPGTGKSHLLAALAHELILQGHRVLWTPTALLVQRLLAAKRDLRLPQAVVAALKPLYA